VWTDGELWRTVTAPLVHANLTHLTVNMALLGLSGWALEARCGRAAFLLVAGLGGLGSAAASALGNSEASLGSSGAVFAVLGALWAVGTRTALLGPGRASLVGLLLVLLALSGGPRIDTLAHLTGLAVGGALGVGLPGALGRALRQRAVDRGVAFAAAALVLVGLGSAAASAWALDSATPEGETRRL
jgi:membrane associated rhomboid family serine protease